MNNPLRELQQSEVATIAVPLCQPTQQNVGAAGQVGTDFLIRQGKVRGFTPMTRRQLQQRAVALRGQRQQSGPQDLRCLVQR